MAEPRERSAPVAPAVARKRCRFDESVGWTIAGVMLVMMSFIMAIWGAAGYGGRLPCSRGFIPICYDHAIAWYFVLEIFAMFPLWGGWAITPTPKDRMAWVQMTLAILGALLTIVPAALLMVLTHGL